MYEVLHENCTYSDPWTYGDDPPQNHSENFAFKTASCSYQIVPADPNSTDGYGIAKIFTAGDVVIALAIAFLGILTVWQIIRRHA